MKKNNEPTFHWSIREERELAAKKSKEKKSVVDEIKDSAKKHFEEIFNRR